MFFRIENEYVLALMILYILSFVSGVLGDNFGSGFSTAATTFALTLVLNRFNLIGGGDIKLLFPVILFSENYLHVFWMGMSIGGIVLAVFYLLFNHQIFFIRRSMVHSLYSLSRSRNKSRLLNFALPSLRRIDKRVVALRKYTASTARREIPYGIAISCGGFCVIFEHLLTRW
jgi:Flp pilus assembly protein protease CpaA